MRWSKAKDMTERTGWSIKTDAVLSRGRAVDWVYFTDGTDRIWLCTFTDLYQMSKADFAASLAKLPQEQEARSA